MGRFRIQHIKDDNTWSTRYNTPKNDKFSKSSSELTKVILIFTVQQYGIELIYHQIDTPHANMSSGNFTITHFEYYMDQVKCFED